MTNNRIPTSDWLVDKLNGLVEMTETIRKISPEQYTEVDPDYGFWSLKKEIALMYWTFPFQIIASKYFPSFYYIDLFAGSGLMKAENCFFVGSPIVAVSSTIKEKPFNKYICVEYDEGRRNALEKRLDKACSYHQTCKAEVIRGDCNQDVNKILNQHSPTGRTCYLAFVDPQKYTDLKWNTLESLMNYGIGDIILNFPTMSINRNITKQDSIPSVSLFVGDDVWTTLQPLNIDTFLEYFKEKMRKYRKEVHSLTVNGDGNNRLFDLVFATNSIGMNNSLEDLRKRLNGITTKTIKGLYSVVAEGQRQMFDFLKK